MRLNRRAAEELYDPKRKKDYKEHLVHQVGSYANTGKSFAELRRMTIKQLLKLRHDSPRLNDPKLKRKVKRSAWIQFVIAHKNMRTKKGLIDLRAISKLWKLKKGVKTKR